MPFEDDEDELQARLEKSAPIKDIRDESCVFCGDPAESWVKQDEIQILLPDEWEGRLSPVCESCKNDVLNDDECIACSIGDFCLDHDPLDWIVQMLEDDEEYDDEE